MAVYGTRAEFVNAIGEARLFAVADRDDDGELDSELLDSALATASEMVDSYISAYLANIVVVPSLKQSTFWIAFELLHVGDQSTEDSRLGYDRAIKWLTAIAKGDLTLPGQPGSGGSGGDGSIVDPGDPETAVGGERGWTQRGALRLF